MLMQTASISSHCFQAAHLQFCMLLLACHQLLHRCGCMGALLMDMLQVNRLSLTILNANLLQGEGDKGNCRGPLY